MKKTMTKNQYKLYYSILIVLVLGLVVFANIIATQLERAFNLKMDLTETRIYSLSQESENVLNHINQPIYIYTLFETGDEDVVITEILQKYAAGSHYVELSNVDPTTNPGFTLPYDPQSEGVAGGSVVVTNADASRYKVLGFFDLYQAQYTQAGGLFVTGIKAEQSISSAINYIETGVNPRMMFLAGHGETTTLSAFFNTLTASGYQVAEYNVFAEETPLDTKNDTLMVVSPKQDLTDDEYTMLDAFLANGGNAMFFMDTVIYDNQTGGLRLLTEPLNNFNALLQQYNIKPNMDLIVGETASNTYQRSTSLIPEITEHMITAPMIKANRSPIISDTSSLIIPTRPSDLITITPLLIADEASYAKAVGVDLASIDKIKTDEVGPFALAVLAQKGDSSLIVFATSSIISTDAEFNLSGNRDLMAACIAYLNQREDAIAITPKSMAGNVLQLRSSGQQTVLIILVVVVLPLSVLIAGFMVWLKRKRA